MKKNPIKIIIGLIVLALIIFLIYLSVRPERTFNRVPMSEKNAILNSYLPQYYDTVISVALDEMDIQGQTIVVRKISDAAKNSTDGVEIAAHIRYQDGVFYLFASDFSRRQAVEVLSHEIIHVDQYLNGDLVYVDNSLIWKGKQFNLNDIKYEVRPWETDAFDRQGGLIDLVEGKLY